MNVAIAGTGYVGLTTGAMLAYLGHRVISIDTDQEKVERLCQGEVPIFEPGLPKLLEAARERITFTASYEEAIPQADVVFITVGTPLGPDGSPNLSYLESAADQIGRHLSPRFTLIVNKSTVPIGSGNWVQALVRDSLDERNGEAPKARFAVVSNPEFLKEGTALFDSFYPDRIVVGSQEERAIDIMGQLYRPIINQDFVPPTFLPRPSGVAAVPFVTTDLASAELIKYAANAFLTVKISFMNEIGELAEKVGADILQVARGIGLDQRIGNRFLQAGAGWGGSCFAKDTAALIATGQEYGLQMPIIQASRSVNNRARRRVIDKLRQELKILKGRRIGMLGLAFKPNTDDLRDAPALEIARELRSLGATVVAHDPVALDRARRELAPNGTLQYSETAAGVFERSDAVVLITEWPEYQSLPYSALIGRMEQPLLVDARNFLNREQLLAMGWRYHGLGR
ncbi:MAG: UDP-glucose dehydrogenase family protein [Bryobacteraceae bacterium]